MKMTSSPFQRLVFFIFFYRSVLCSSLSKRELKRPEKIIGEVYTYVGSNLGQSYPVDVTLHQVPLQDLRRIDQVPNLKTWGFTYVSGRHVAGIENMEEFSVQNQAALKADSVELVKELTGAKTVFALGGGYRDHETSGSVRSVKMIHSDMTLQGARWFKTKARRQMLTSRFPSDVEFGKYVMEGKNIVVYNVWRPLHTVQDNHLGLARWDPHLKEDALTGITDVTNVRNALQPWRYSKDQEWYYLSQQEPHEVYVFKQHESGAKDGHGVNVPHASFNFKDFQGPEARKSYEIRVIAVIEPSFKRRLSQMKDRIKSIVKKFKWNSSRNLDQKKA
ncbi:hypothetical protein DFH28DRAFT_1092175 [Melampsora americana]|nr:hypothetical protein DFH28DRAFT_1092175 [Melampsora americana]